MAFFKSLSSKKLKRSAKLHINPAKGIKDGGLREAAGTVLDPAGSVLGIGPREFGLPDPIRDEFDPIKDPVIPEPAAIPDEQAIDAAGRRRFLRRQALRGGRSSTRLGGERAAL